MNEFAMRADRGGDDKGKSILQPSQDHLDVFICSHSSRTSQGVSTMDECTLVTVSSSALPTGRQDSFVGSYMLG
jgi:hypothetical protein